MLAPRGTVSARIAVIGAGPAGFYTDEQLFNEGFEVDVHDAAAFTNPELRELGELQRAGVIVDPAELELDEHSAGWLATDASATARNNVEILRQYAQREPAGKSHQIELRFLRSPVEVIGEGEDGAVSALRLVRNQITSDLRAVPSDEQEILECGLVLRSIGYRGKPLPGVAERSVTSRADSLSPPPDADAGVSAHRPKAV